jgi:hypothetical protein
MEPIRASHARFRRLLFVAAAVGVMFLVGRSGASLYDGLGFPDEPYRYVHPPHGYSQRYAPTNARVPVSLAGGTNPHEGLISSGESGPQVGVYLPPRALVADSALTTVVVTARPVGGGRLPVDGVVNSNVYAVAFNPPAATVRPGLGTTANVSLRQAVFETVVPVMEFRASDRDAWLRLNTVQIGRDIYLGPWSGPGEYVLVQPASGTAQTRRDSDSNHQLVVILGFCVLVVVGALFAVRRWGAEAGETPRDQVG